MTRRRNPLLAPLLVLAFLYVLLEETVWRWARALGARLARLPLLAALERRIPLLPPWALLTLFLVPLAALLPLKIAALWLLAQGRPVAAVALLAAAKMLGTAISARLYMLAEPRLMEMPLFRRLRGRALRVLAAAHGFLDGLAAWRAVRRATARMRAALSRLAARLRVLLLGRGVGFRARLRILRRRWRGDAGRPGTARTSGRKRRRRDAALRPRWPAAAPCAPPPARSPPPGPDPR